MFSPVKSHLGKNAEGDLREWAVKLVGGGRLRWEPGCAAEVAAGSTGKPFRLAGRSGTDGVKPIPSLRQDLVTEPRVPPSVLGQLEPLKEPPSSHCKMEKTNPPVTEATYVGVDVSKDRLDYTVDGVRSDHVPNTAAGLRRLTAELAKLNPPARVVCEATGGYERAAVAALLLAKLEVCVVNPGRVRAFAQAEGLLAKTDRLDALLLRRFGEKVRPRLHAPMDEQALTLRELLDHRRQLSDQVVAVRNRQELARPTLRKLLSEQLRFLEDKLAEVDRLIDELIDQDPTLRLKAERLRQLKGVGPVLAATLLAYVPELGDIEDKSLSALIGVAPYARSSGKSDRKRFIRGGRAVVRHVLYMAAVCAARHNRILAEFYQRLLAKGKPASVALVAVMRKMLGVLNRLLADPQFTLVR